MDSELFVITFPLAEDARKARRALRIMREQQSLGLQYSVVASTDSPGQAEVQFQASLPLNLNDRNLWLLCQFVNALYCRDCEIFSRLVKAGADKVFLDELKAALLPETSALIIYDPPNRHTDLSRLATVLSLFTGRLYRATFPATVEETLLGLPVPKKESEQ